jgi:hypothetical protein
VDYLYSIIFQPETPILRQEAPKNLQDTHDDLQGTRNDTQDNKMTFSWRDLSYDEDANAHLIDHFCRRGTLDKDPTKPSRSVLLQLLLKKKVASVELIIDGFEEGIPILIRARAHVSEYIDRVPKDASTTATPTATPMQEASQPLQYLTQSQSQLQPHTQATPTQLAMEDARLAKVAYAKATRIAQERMQKAAQEANRIKQDATADSKKANKEDCYRAAMEKLGKLPPCPKLCRGEECSGTLLRGGGAGPHLRAHGNMVLCQERPTCPCPPRTGVSCFMCGHRGRGHQSFLQDLWQDILQKTGSLQKTRAGEPPARGKPPRTTATRGRGSHLRQERGPSSSSLGSSSRATPPTRGRLRG